MTDYNDGKIHGWNGGECPVHPQSVVDVWNDLGFEGKSPANRHHWHLPSRVRAFRVVEAHRDPLEKWSFGSYMYSTREDAESFRARLAADHPGYDYESMSIKHWREVTK